MSQPKSSQSNQLNPAASEVLQEAPGYAAWPLASPEFERRAALAIGSLVLEARKINGVDISFSPCA